MSKENKKRDGFVKIINFPKLIASILIPFLAGAIGSYFTAPAIPTWYAALEKPFFNPPNWLFGPVWSTLYILMGVSFYLIWIDKAKSQNKNKNKAIYLFFTQLSLNTLWSILFFGLKSPSLAFVGIIALLTAIVFTYKEFKKISVLSSKLLLPYIFWVSFAAVLNLSIALLN